MGEGRGQCAKGEGEGNVNGRRKGDEASKKEGVRKKERKNEGREKKEKDKTGRVGKEWKERNDKDRRR